ncbi:MAG: hypothetical protein U0350_39930 [Caldilineaceae bacterium]
MRIKLLRALFIGGQTYAIGNEVTVDEAFALYLIGNGSAEAAEADGGAA